MTRMLELSGKDFTVAIIKLLQQAIYKHAWSNEKMESLRKETEHLSQKTGNFRLENSNEGNLKTQWMGSIAEWKQQRKDSVSLKIEQKWPNVNNRQTRVFKSAESQSPVGP